MRKLAERLNIELRKLRRERHRFNRGDLELKEAVTNISHDLRTPLTAISGYLDLLDREEKNDVVNRYIETIKNRIELMKQLTEELFQYSIVISSEYDLKTMDTGKIIFSNFAPDLSEVEVERLFDRFYTVENARKSTGLGLSISRVLIEKMNGSISAQYKNGRLSIAIQLPERSK